MAEDAGSMVSVAVAVVGVDVPVDPGAAQPVNSRISASTTLDGRIPTPATPPVASLAVVAAGILRPLLFQFAEHGFDLAPMVEFEFRRAAGETAELKRYPGGHDLKVDAARDDRRAFLALILEPNR